MLAAGLAELAKTEITVISTDPNKPGGFMSRHPVIANSVIILGVAAVGILIVYYSLALFTKHGRSTTVPSVENMSYTQAVNILHDRGLRVDIRDSVYNEDVRPGYVMEQFPKSGSAVKPGRKIFLYINAVHPKEVVLDDSNHPMEDALKGLSARAAQAKLEEFGFKNVRVITVLGADDRVVKVLANGRVVKKTQKVPLNARITLEISDGRLAGVVDSLRNAELLRYVDEQNSYYDDEQGGYLQDEPSYDYPDDPQQSQPAPESREEEEPQYEFAE